MAIKFRLKKTLTVIKDTAINFVSIAYSIGKCQAPYTCKRVDI